MFARYAPASTGGDFKEVLERAERTSYVHADVPTLSNHPLLAVVKRVLRTVMAFYVRFLAQEVTAFAGAITRAVQLLGQRVDHLEQVTVIAAEQALTEVQRRQPSGPSSGRVALDLAPWSGWVSTRLATVTGRVLHAECGDGHLLEALGRLGLDAYGVEPDESLAMAAATSGVDVRADDAVAHLRMVPDGALGGLVLTGLIDRLPIGGVLEVADLAAAKLAPGGILVVLSSGPAAWQRSLDPVVADLAPGRPLHPETWEHLLAARGFDAVCVERDSAGGAGATGATGSAATLAPLPAGAADPAVVAVHNANVELLNRLLFSPGAYGVTATRPRSA
jgi:hypothetical protein